MTEKHRQSHKDNEIRIQNKNTNKSEKETNIISYSIT